VGSCGPPVACKLSGVVHPMKALRRQLAKLAALLASLTVLWACNAPSIPVPPPDLAIAFAAHETPDVDGGTKTTWIATQSNPIPQAAFAKFYLYDMTRGSGIIQMANGDGTFVSAPMDGDMGDQIAISYETPAGGLSASVCLVLAEGPTAARCPE
jgi:hypothetical protein